MKYKEFGVGDIVLVSMPKGAGFTHPQKAKVIEKGTDGICLFEKPDGRRWFTNSRRILSVQQKC